MEANGDLRTLSCGVSEEAWLSMSSHGAISGVTHTPGARSLCSALRRVIAVCGLRRDHLLSSYAAGVARELAADADKLNLATGGDDVQVAVRRNSALVQRLKSLVRRSDDS